MKQAISVGRETGAFIWIHLSVDSKIEGAVKRTSMKSTVNVNNKKKRILCLAQFENSTHREH